MEKAEIEILRLVQTSTFSKEIEALQRLERTAEAETRSNRRAGVKQSSPLRKLDPFLKNGLLHLGGRLSNAPIGQQSKHQIILPKRHHVVELIIRHHHTTSGHSGIEYVLSRIRERFWIVKARVAVRRVLGQCFGCKKRHAQAVEQKMADLPMARVTPDHPPFTFVGVDCFGPMLVRRGRSTVKRYGVIFTCMTVRAVHIEIAHSLDTDSFISSLRRFIARRGPPQEMRSDNGTNFVGGERELREAINEWNQRRIHDILLSKNVKWIFNPPSGSHHGGAWERCIRTTRKILQAILKEQTMCDEGLATLMCEVEAIMNGRPLTKVSDDPNDLEALTPNHLILLRPGTTLPPGTFHKDDSYCRRRWRQVQYLADVFWRRWIKEYLPSLQVRQKWHDAYRNLQPNDIVLVVDDSAPRSSWPLGRVLEVYHNGTDGLVRSVKVKTKSSIYVRPISKIVLLEAAETSSGEQN